MKIFNIIACIVVLVLALVSAVCSYFLYEKRVQFVDGWEQMSNAIYNSAKTIDSRSDKKFASKLTADDLSHKKYSKDGLAGKLKNLTDQSEAFVKQYDELTKRYEDMVALQKKTKAELDRVVAQRRRMADVFVKIGQQVGANTGTAAKFIDPLTYGAQIAGVQNKVSQVYTNRELIGNTLEKIARENKVAFNKQALFSRGDMSAIRTIVNNNRAARAEYAKSLKEIASSLNGKFADDGKPATSISKSVTNMINTLSATRSQLSNARADVSALKTTVGRRDAEISRLNKVISDYKRVLNLDQADSDPKVWLRGSNEARSALVGSVISVVPDYGYIVIDFGTASTVKQTVGNKVLTLNPDVESGLEFNIVRDDKFIATITLSNVDANQSTANIPAEKAGLIKVGDKVVFKK